MKIENRILLTLLDTPSIGRAIIAEKADVKKPTLNSYIQGMKKNNLIVNTEYGKYQLTEIGQKKALKLIEQSSGEVIIPSIKSTEQSQKSKSPLTEKIIDDIDLEDINTILRIKEKYGRENLLRIIDKIRKLIE